MNHLSEFQSKTILVLYLIFAVRKRDCQEKEEERECNILFLIGLLNKLRHKNNSTAKPPSQICTSLQLKRAEVFRNLKHSTVAKDFTPLSTWTLEERFCKEVQEALNYLPKFLNERTINTIVNQTNTGTVSMQCMDNFCEIG